MTIATGVFAVGCSLIGGATAVKSNAPAGIVVVQGDGQAAQAGRDLPTPIVLRVLDSSGTAVSGVVVSMSINGGGGSVTPASDTTDGHGEFKTKWTLGPTVVQQSLIATVAGVTPVSIAATALLPTQIILVQGDKQTAKAGAAVTNSVIVRVVGGVNVPMQGVTVEFQVLAGG
ncbi:MAG: hypothetical protein ACREPM_01690, partial [Gemmatimonadaceae bacterium]